MSLKRLKRFNTPTDYIEAKEGNKLTLPAVSLVLGGG